jgi:type I restriction enzyme M protein
VVDPQKTDKILDPAVGTAGFLISTYQHLLKQNTLDGSNKPGSALTIDDRKKFANNFVGYDVSHDLVRLSLVNLYLHNFADPKIYEYDTLGNVDRWDDDFDCILTNPPFMTPKGGVKPHKRFSIQAKRSEVLFVDYIMEHLNPNGKAGIIVPEGIIFKSDTAYKALRKMMIDQNFLYAVVSLPSGIFQPYSGVKTYILLMDRILAKKTKDILFVKVENDGFDLGAQRRPIDKNDLPKAAEILQKYKMIIQTGKPFEFFDDEKKFANLVPMEKISQSGDYNLSGDRYKKTIALVNQKWPMVELGDVLDYEQPTNYIVESVDYNDKYLIPVLTAGKSFILGYTDEKKGVFNDGLPVIIFDDFTTAIKFVDFPFKVKSSAMKILHAKKNKANIKYVYYAMQNIKFAHSEHKRFWISEYSKIKIPLPPLNIQKEIVLRIEEEQQRIDDNKKLIQFHQDKIKEMIDEVWGE